MRRSHSKLHCFPAVDDPGQHDADRDNRKHVNESTQGQGADRSKKPEHEQRYRERRHSYLPLKTAWTSAHVLITQRDSSGSSGAAPREVSGGKTTKPSKLDGVALLIGPDAAGEGRAHIFKATPILSGRENPRCAVQHSDPSQSKSLEMRADHRVTLACGVFQLFPFQDPNSSIPGRDQP